MGIGDADIEPVQYADTIKLAGFASMGLWAVGALIGAKKLKDIGLGGSIVAFGVQLLAKR